ncbi:MAG TPA: hypothetical protein VGI39_13040 [Polyangiaceae bacterium]
MITQERARAIAQNYLEKTYNERRAPPRATSDYDLAVIDAATVSLDYAWLFAHGCRGALDPAYIAERKDPQRFGPGRYSRGGGTWILVERETGELSEITRMGAVKHDLERYERVRAVTLARTRELVVRSGLEIACLRECRQAIVATEAVRVARNNPVASTFKGFREKFEPKVGSTVWDLAGFEETVSALRGFGEGRPLVLMSFTWGQATFTVVLTEPEVTLVGCVRVKPRA